MGPDNVVALYGPPAGPTSTLRGLIGWVLVVVIPVIVIFGIIILISKKRKKKK